MASLLDLVLPPACAACGSSGALLCDRCLRAMPPPARASDAFVAPDAGVVIGETVTLAISALAYEGPVRRALGRLKYAGAARVAGPLATAALPAFDRLLAISGPASLVPVPVHLERRRTRGYNQAALIAEALTRARRLPMIDLLERRHATERQHRLDRAARLRNLRDAIGVRRGIDLPPTVIVVDDIVTTSATLDACASVLRAAGADEVYGFAVAREV